ncbi:hypothetical protein KKE26_05865 [bacterium]|nr:hypothetical protein [bacterium]MBU1752762.1 hypothetical protein [bacterium]
MPQARSPIKVKRNITLVLKTAILFFVDIIFWAILLIASSNVVCYYINSIKLNGWLNKETFGVSLSLIIGTYFFLIVSKKQIYEALGIKTECSYIQMGDSEEIKCQN